MIYKQLLSAYAKLGNWKIIIITKSYYKIFKSF
jgi:hypothetical protein